MTRIYRYILTHDSGMAPCPTGGLITLATCKPVIRRTAQPGDWVLGFRPGSLERGLLLWAGKVEQVLDHGDYEREFRGRPDAVYRKGKDGGYQRLLPDYHPTQQEMHRDTSAPVLLFDSKVSLYFNGQPQPLPQELAHLAAAGRGHRVSGTAPGDVLRLEAWLANLAPLQPANANRVSATSRSGCGPRSARTSCGSQGPAKVKRGC